MPTPRRRSLLTVQCSASQFAVGADLRGRVGVVLVMAHPLCGSGAVLSDGVERSPERSRGESVVRDGGGRV